MCNSFFLHIEWSLNIAFVNQFYCMHHGIGFKIIEFLQTFAMFSIGGWAAHGMVFSFRLLIFPDVCKFYEKCNLYDAFL